MAESTKADDIDQINNGSSSDDTSSSVMLKPYLKTLGKEFYQNEELGRYDSLREAVTDLLKRPKAKDVPESYGYDDDTDVVFKAAGLTEKEAKAINEHFSKKIPPKKPELKEVFGDEYDSTIDLYSKGVKSIASDIEDELKKSGLDKDPTVVKLLARVGKETGGEPFVANPKHESKPTRNRFLDIINNAK